MIKIVPIESIISKIIFLRGEKVLSLRSQFGTLKRGAHSKCPLMAFTEQCVAMLSSPDKPRKKIGFTVKEKVSKYGKKKQVSRKNNG